MHYKNRKGIFFGIAYHKYTCFFEKNRIILSIMRKMQEK